MKRKGGSATGVGRHLPLDALGLTHFLDVPFGVLHGALLLEADTGSANGSLDGVEVLVFELAKDGESWGWWGRGAECT